MDEDDFDRLTRELAAFADEPSTIARSDQATAWATDTVRELVSIMLSSGEWHAGPLDEQRVTRIAVIWALKVKTYNAVQLQILLTEACRMIGSCFAHDHPESFTGSPGEHP